MGNITRIITQKSHWISENDFDIISKENDVTFSSAKEVTINGENDGQFMGNYDYSEDEVSEKIFPFGWWSKDYKGKIRANFFTSDNLGFKASLEDTIYFQLDVYYTIPLETKIEFKLCDYDESGIGILFMLPWDFADPDDDEFGAKGNEIEIKSLALYEKLTVKRESH